nr:hypothetical protein [Tanacetum cinerariifolium]
CAANAHEAFGVQWVDGHAIGLGEGHALLPSPVVERVNLDEVVARIPLGGVHALAVLRLLGADARYPGLLPG